MERNRFLQLAQGYASGKGTRVRYDGHDYFPISYTIGPLGAGGWLHSARLKDTVALDSYISVPLDSVEEVQ